jgi:hypothetical protein
MIIHNNDNKKSLQHHRIPLSSPTKVLTGPIVVLTSQSGWDEVLYTRYDRKRIARVARSIFVWHAWDGSFVRCAHARRVMNGVSKNAPVAPVPCACGACPGKRSGRPGAPRDGGDQPRQISIRHGREWRKNEDEPEEEEATHSTHSKRLLYVWRRQPRWNGKQMNGAVPPPRVFERPRQVEGAGIIVSRAISSLSVKLLT